MPPVTRSKELLNLIDGLFFIEQDTIDLASIFYTELKSTMATYGEQSIEKVLPHISELFNKLDEFSKSNSELKKENEALLCVLQSTKSPCVDLDVSYKDKSLACCELKDQYDSEVNALSAELAACKEANLVFKEKLNKKVAVEVDVDELRDKIDTLTADRLCLLTTVEVLEAEMKCLRTELRTAESHARKRKSSVGEDLLAELTAVEMSCPQPSEAAYVNTSTNTEPEPGVPTASRQNDLKDVLVIGDSHLRYAGRRCENRGAYLECCPGAKIMDIKNRLLSYVDVSLSVIYLHVGCNNLRYGYHGGPGYNGGHGKREVLHRMADLLYTARTKFPDAKVFLSSVLVRRDISYKALHDFNQQLELMCYNFGVELVNANSCVRRTDLVRDGVHFNRRASSRLGSLLVNTVSEALRGPDTSEPQNILIPSTEGVAAEETNSDGSSESGSKVSEN